MGLENHTSRCTICHNIRKDMSNGFKSCQRCLDSKRAHIMTRLEKDSYNISKKKWRQSEYGKAMTLAHAYVGVALKRGKIVKMPCEVCGELKVEAHHKDYSKRLEVNWLCHTHHSEVHYVCMG